METRQLTPTGLSTEQATPLDDPELVAAAGVRSKTLTGDISQLYVLRPELVCQNSGRYESGSLDAWADSIRAFKVSCAFDEAAI
jgi:hypothetical protein